MVKERSFTIHRVWNSLDGEYNVVECDFCEWRYDYRDDAPGSTGLHDTAVDEWAYHRLSHHKYVALGADTHSSASRQHYIDTGSYLPEGEEL